eukprot:TRINITY_DN8367_c0_g1_i1.p1 TRINITY_DN8367_c0_g1~~TRINITY_DN8367_c0_g1_i1.p1  ORF type:complete len:188 (-),score=40.19 TRINITY_DN8367_c0_g1_i1:3-566(-)
MCNMYQLSIANIYSSKFILFFNETATTEIYTLHIVGSVRCVQETGYQRRVHGDTSINISVRKILSYFIMRIQNEVKKYFLSEIKVNCILCRQLLERYKWIQKKKIKIKQNVRYNQKPYKIQQKNGRHHWLIFLKKSNLNQADLKFISVLSLTFTLFNKQLRIFSFPFFFLNLQYINYSLEIVQLILY